MMKTMFLYLLAAGLMLSCAASKDVRTVTVASQTRRCMGVAPMECMLVKYSPDDQWTFFYGNIEGFSYEPGYEYILKVSTEKVDNPPADASSIRYILVKEVSKTPKQSACLPQDIPGASGGDM